MEFDWIWETIVIFFVGKMILRIGGRKSIAQLTITQAIVMVGIGSLLIQPLTDRGIVITLLTALIFVLLMVVTEYLEMKFDFFETFFSGKSKIVIENGKLNLDNIKKLRLTIDKLEMRIRQSGIASIEDIERATIEVSGQLGYKLKEGSKAITRDELISIITGLTPIDNSVLSLEKKKQSKKKGDIFKEIK